MSGAKSELKSKSEQEVSLQQLSRATVKSIDDLYLSLSLGLDASPARLYRLEGKLELLIEAQILSHQEVVDCIQSSIAKHAIELSQDYLSNHWKWCLQSSYIRLPIKQSDAPVYES